jgi:integrase
MIQSVRYQKGHLYEDHGALFVRYRLGIRQADGSIKLQRMAERLGKVEDFATKAEAETARQAFMQKVNSAQTSLYPSMTLDEFVEQFYLPWVKSELRASTYKSYRDIWNLYLAGRVGAIRLRQFRTVDASRMLRSIAEDCDLTKTTLGHIKSVLSGVFTHAKNEGAYDGENPVEGARIPRNAREPGETYAYNLVQILRILELLPLLPKAVAATASFAGLREGELCGVEWPDFTGDALTVKRSVWKTIVNEPKTRASRQAVPVIPTLAKILDEYRASMHNPRTGVIFHQGNRERMDMDKLAQRVIRPAVEASGLPWYGWHGFRRGIASNLYELGANEKIVQRVLRHAKPHVAKDRYIKAFDPAVLEAMQRMQAVVDGLVQQWPAVGQQQN